MRNTNQNRKLSLSGKTQTIFPETINISTFGRKLLKWAYITLIFGFLAIGNLSCRTQPPTVIQKEEIIWTYKDSLVTRDSVTIIPIERYVDIVPIYDTLVLSTSLSESRSWVDTTNHSLRGVIKNLKAAQTQIKYVERVVMNDSIVKVELPVPYPVVEKERYIPKWSWITLLISVGVLGYGGWKLYRRFKPI